MAGLRASRSLGLVVASVLAALPGSIHVAGAADAAFGEYLSSECVACHRRDGQDKGIPSIIGWPTEQFVAALHAYKAKDRPNAIMQTIAGRLSENEMAALADFYQGLQPH